MDCMEAMKEYTDGYFDLVVADPPYGINITARHRSQTIQVERERERGGHHLSGEKVDHSVVMAKPYGAAKTNLASQNFIPCSTTVPRRTKGHSGNYKESVKS